MKLKILSNRFHTFSLLDYISLPTVLLKNGGPFFHARWVGGFISSDMSRPNTCFLPFFFRYKTSLSSFYKTNYVVPED